MQKNRRFKEAFKWGLAFAMVYGIALKLSWMNPYWAGWAVAMIALPTTGQTMYKGLNRMVGTVIAFFASLFIFSMAAQDRWLFAFLGASWIVFTTYKMISSKNNSYLWYIAGFVCLIILISTPRTSENIFNHALFRTLETAMGILVYSLITFFIWPINNKGAIRKSAIELLEVQLSRIQEVNSLINGKQELDRLMELGQHNTQKMDQLNGFFIAEGSENYNVYEELPQWRNFLNISNALYVSQNRLETHIKELKNCDTYSILPMLSDFQNEIDDRFEQMKKVINNSTTIIQPTNYNFKIDQNLASKHSVFERAALEVSKQNLQQINDLSIDLFNCLTSLMNGSSKRIVSNKKLKHASKTMFAFPDLDILKRGLYAGTVTFLGFCLWIFFDPVGHIAWFSFGGTLAMMLAGTPQLKIAMVFKPIAVTFLLAMLVYIFIMPTLTTFYGLGILLFSCLFLVGYFFTGFGQVIGSAAIVNMVMIQNQQHYDAAVVFNLYLFTLLALLFFFATSYLISSARPEKVVLKYMNHFFVDIELICSHLLKSPNHKISLFKQWELDYARKNFRTIPSKINSWGRSIDFQLFPNVSPNEITNLVTTLETLVYRIEELNETEQLEEQNFILKESLLNDLNYWNAALERVFANWSKNPGAKIEERKLESFNDWSNKFESKVELSISNASTSASINEIEGVYKILGALRGVSEAVKLYSHNTQNMDWKQLKEERFS